MSLDHEVFCISAIDADGVATMSNHMDRFAFFSHTSVLIGQTGHGLRLGESVIVQNPASEKHDQIGVVCKFRDSAGKPVISVSFDGEVYCFSPNELVLA